MRVSIISLIFVIVSASAFNDDPPGTKYYIQNAKTQNYLFMGRKSNLPSGRIVGRNAYVWNIPNTIPPYDAKDSQFYLLENNAIGPYYQIQNVGCECILFGSEYTVAPELNNSVNIVMAWEAGEHYNTPESMWNIRHFNDQLYILNVHYGAYLYTTKEMASPTSVDRNKRYAVLMPSDTAGRVAGTEWLLTVVDEGQGFMAESPGLAFNDEGEAAVADEEKDGDSAGIGEKYGGVEGGEQQDGKGEEGKEEDGEREKGEEEDGESEGEGEEDGERVRNEKVTEENKNVGEEKVVVDQAKEEMENGKGKDESVENNKSLQKDPPEAEGKANERKMEGEEVVEDKIGTQVVEVEKEEEKKDAPIETDAPLSEKGVEGNVEKQIVDVGKSDWENDEIEGNKGEQVKEENGELSQEGVAVKNKEEQVEMDQKEQRTDMPVGTDKTITVKKYGDTKVIGEKVDQKKVGGERIESVEKYTTVTFEQDSKVQVEEEKLEGELVGDFEKVKSVEKDLISAIR